jgi:hypothetical protein
MVLKPIGVELGRLLQCSKCAHSMTSLAALGDGMARLMEGA